MSLFGVLQKTLFGGAIVAVLAYAGVVGLLVLWQRHILFPGAYAGMPTFGHLPPGIEATSVTAPDATVLRALWRPPRPGCGVVLSFHGNGSYPEEAASRFSTGPWLRHGWGLLAIAYRGYPGSTGSPSEAGLITDGRAALAEARRRAPEAPVLIHGHSLGAAIAVAVAEAEPDHLALYLEAPFASVEALAGARFPWIPVSLLLRDPLRSDGRIGGVAGPIVIVHGTRDGVVPIEEGRRLAAAAPPGTVFDAIDADHVSLLGVRDDVYEPRFRSGLAGCR